MGTEKKSGAPAKRGRPPLPKGTRRDEWLKIRVTAKELREMRKRAKAAKTSLTEFVVSRTLRE